MKFMLLLLVALIGALVGLSLADTRVLHNVNFDVNGVNREETFTLNNENTSEQELVIMGTETFPSEDGLYNNVVETIYVIDKNGFHVKYKVVHKMQVYYSHGGSTKPLPIEPVKKELNISTLKSLGGGLLFRI